MLRWLQVAASGLIVNSMGWIEDLGYQLLLHTIRALEIDVVLVVGAERLFHNLQQALSCAPADGAHACMHSWDGQCWLRHCKPVACHVFGSQRMPASAHDASPSHLRVGMGHDVPAAPRSVDMLPLLCPQSTHMQASAAICSPP